MSRIFLISCALTVSILFIGSHMMGSTHKSYTKHGDLADSIADVLNARSSPQNAEAQRQGWAAAVQKRLVKRAALDISSNGSPTTILITDTLPSTLHLPSTLLRAWDDAFNSLSSLGTENARESIKRIGLKGPIQGVPGTGISDESEARALQDHLDCMSGKGEWVEMSEGSQVGETSGQAGLTVHKQESVYASCDRRYYKGRDGDTDDSPAHWDVRNSLKWKWRPSPSCAASAPPGVPRSASLSRSQFCRLLAHKSTLVVGDTPQYSLHDLLLDWTSLTPQSCYGDLYCKEHALCGDILRADGGIEDWTADERVYHRLPLPPAAPELEKRALPVPDTGADSTTHEKRQLDKNRSPSYGTMLRYRRSDGLRSATAQTLPTYSHPSTSVREINQQWLADSRRSDVVILSKGPLPLPMAGHNTTWDESYFPRRLSASPSDDELEAYAGRMIAAAYDITANVWLPELLETLRAVRAPPSPTLEQLIVYRGGWRSHPDCAASQLDEEDPVGSWSEWAKRGDGDGPPPHLTQPSLNKLIFRWTTNAQGQRQRRLVDEHSLFFNLQTIFQNHIARTTVLPAFGIPFLDLESMLSVWRSGMVGSSAAASFQPSSSASRFVDQSKAHGLGVGLRSAASGDCSRYCVPSPGSAIEEAFIGGLLRVSAARMSRPVLYC